MYGLCHHGIREFAIESFGQDTWDGVMQRLELVGDIELEAYYHDDVTDNLMNALMKESGLESEVLLQQFGEYWINFTQSTKHAKHMHLDESLTLVDFLATVNDLHSRLLVIIPDLILPDFQIEQLNTERFRLHYRSARQGLAPMVLGLINGLAKHYACQITVQHKEQTVETGSYVIFDIKQQTIEPKTVS